MKRNHLFILGMAAVTALTACGTSNASEESTKPSENISTSEIVSTEVSAASQTSEITSISEQSEAILLSLETRKSFTQFKQNKATKEEKREEFYDLEQTYEVGDDNAFKLKPSLVFDIDDTIYTDDEVGWEAGWNVSVKEGSNEVSTDLYAFDKTECTIDFAEGAIGKTLTVTVNPNGLTEAQAKQSKWYQTLEVKVVDGFNLYDAKELTYIDDRSVTMGEDELDSASGDVSDYTVDAEAFKTANGLDSDYHPTTVILHENIDIKPEDVYPVMFYTEEELKDETSDEKLKSVGSTKDYFYFYVKNSSSAFTLNGNYFKLDYSEIPLITRERGAKTEEGQVVSHSALFKVNDGSITFKNINISGNGKNATSDEDAKFSGSLMTIKAANCTSKVTIENAIQRKGYMFVMTEKPADGYDVCETEIIKSKVFDNFNSFLYNWGGTMTISNSEFNGCGGPIIIQDQTSCSDLVFEGTQEEYYAPKGCVPHTTFTDCILDNYVAGTEAWFQQFNATALAPQIRALSDLFAPFGYAYAADENKNAIIDKMAKSGVKKLFNFIALNKSSESEGMTAYNVCGEVSIINTAGKSAKYDYSQPDTTLAVTDQQEFVRQMTNHALLRGANSATAPVFQCGEFFAVYNGQQQYLQPLDNAATWTTETPCVDVLETTSGFVASMDDSVALYYNGMMLVFGLKPLDVQMDTRTSIQDK